MTVQELIDILKDRDPSDVVMIEGMRDGRWTNVPVDDDWSACHGYFDGEPFGGFCLQTYDGDAMLARMSHPTDCPICRDAHIRLADKTVIDLMKALRATTLTREQYIEQSDKDFD